MSLNGNPFTPTFGRQPQCYAGEEWVTSMLEAAFEQPFRSPIFSMTITGTRGSGKTCLLSKLSQITQSEGWITVNVSALPDMTNEILIYTTEAANKLLELQQVPSLPHHESSQVPTWRSEMEEILNVLDKNQCGLFLTIDNALASQKELIRTISDYQHFIREDLPIALAIAGEPNEIKSLLKKPEITFLDHSTMISLGKIPDSDVESFFRKTIQNNGRGIGANALRIAVSASGGHAYMMQLVGYCIWDINPKEQRISLSDAEAGVENAKRIYAERMLDPIYRKLSDGDLRFLSHMKPEGESKVTEIAKQMNVSTSYAGQYKIRMLNIGVIEETRRGYIRFSMPGFKNYIDAR